MDFEPFFPIHWAFQNMKTIGYIGVGTRYPWLQNRSSKIPITLVWLGKLFVNFRRFLVLRFESHCDSRAHLPKAPTKITGH